MKWAVAGAALALGFTLTLADEPSARADDAACVDASERALTLRRAGKLRETLKQLAICGAASCPHEITEECSRRARAVDDAMPTLILSATDAAGNDVIAAKATIDGALVTEKLDGRPFALDPGEHVVKLEGAGLVVEKTIVIRESEKGRRENFVLAKVAPPPPTPPPPAPQEQTGLGTQKTLAFVVGGVGIAGVALGAAFGLVANGKKSTEQSDCSSAACSDPGGAASAYSSAKDLATVSTISFIAGAAFIATGVVLYLTAPKGASHATSASASTSVPLRWTF